MPARVSAIFVLFALSSDFTTCQQIINNNARVTRYARKIKCRTCVARFLPRMHADTHSQKLRFVRVCGAHTRTHIRKKNAFGCVAWKRAFSTSVHDHSRFGARNNPIKMLECLDVKWLTESFRARHKYWFAVMPRISAWRTAHIIPERRRSLLALTPSFAHGAQSTCSENSFCLSRWKWRIFLRTLRHERASHTDKLFRRRCEIWRDCEQKCRGCFTIDVTFFDGTSAVQSKAGTRKILFHSNTKLHKKDVNIRHHSCLKCTLKELSNVFYNIF